MEEILKQYMNSNNFNYIYEFDVYNNLLYLFILNELTIYLFSINKNKTSKKNSIQLNNVMIDKNINKNFNIENCFFEINLFIPNEISLILNNQIIFFSDFQFKKYIKNTNNTILSCHFSYFNNYMGILTKDKFIYLEIDSNNEIANFYTEGKNIIDFDFVKKYQRSLEIFDVFFLHKNGNISIIGPIFPKKFKLEKLYLIDCYNFINNQIFYSKEAKLCINLLKNLEEKCLSKEDEIFYFFEIKNEYENVNLNLIEKEIIIINNNENMNEIEKKLIENYKLIGDDEVNNNNKNINYCFIRKYKKIYILVSNPIILLRISTYNEIDVITISENFYCYRINFDFNNAFDNNVTNINQNYLVERINLFLNKDNKLNEDNHKVKIYNYINNNEIKKEYEKIINIYNNKFIIGINNNIFYIKINYINIFKELYENTNKNIKNNFKSKSIKILKNENNNLFNKEIIFYPFLDKIYFICYFEINRNKKILSNSILIKNKKINNNININNDINNNNNNNKDNNNKNKIFNNNFNYNINNFIFKNNINLFNNNNNNIFNNNNNNKLFNNNNNNIFNNNNNNNDDDNNLKIIVNKIKPIKFDKIEKNNIILNPDEFKRLGKINFKVNQLIESNIIKISEHYENIINNNYNKISNKIEKLGEFYSNNAINILNENYQNLETIFNNIEKKKEEINNNNNKIKELIAKTKEKINKIEINNASSYLAKIKTFENDKNNNLNNLEKEFKNIEEKLNNINKFKIEKELNFDNNNDIPIESNTINKKNKFGTIQFLNILNEFVSKLNRNNNKLK